MFIVQKMNKENGFWEKLNLSFCTETAKMEGSAEYNSSYLADKICFGFFEKKENLISNLLQCET